MRFRRKSLLGSFLLIASLLVYSPAPSALADGAKDPDISGGWGPKDAVVGGWAWDGALNDFVRTKPGGPSVDPYQYRFELQCHLGNGDFATGCLAAVVNCKNGPDGKEGIPVVWLKAPVGMANPSWTYHSGPTCLFDPRPEDLLPRIAAMIQTEFQRLPVSAGSVTAQPSPHTLRGAETNFFGNAVEQQFDITILAQRVHVVAKPVAYTWDYGDGVALGPQTAVGGPLPQDRWGEKTPTSHVYAQTGDFAVVLTTHFRGTYSVNGGPPLPIPGQGSFTSPPQPVSVWRSITRNYADDCIQNPQGQGCPAAPPAP
jgi:hypothetical protein